MGILYMRVKLLRRDKDGFFTSLASEPAILLILRVHLMMRLSVL